MRMTFVTGFFLFVAVFSSACARVQVVLHDGGDTDSGDAVEEVVQEPYIFSPYEPSAQQHGPRCELDPQLANRRQLTSSWCWAASTQMVIEHIDGNPIDQCRLVNSTFYGTADTTAAQNDCCKAADEYVLSTVDPNEPQLVQDARAACIQPLWPDQVFVKYNLRKETTYGLTWQQLIEEICQNRPFIFVVRWARGGRHTSVVGGYRYTADARQFVEVYDHFHDDFFVMPYQAFLGVPRDFIHDRDYIEIKH